MALEELDAKDRKILFALELNARIPETKLAKQVGVSREVAAYRLKKLEERGFITKYHAIVNSMNLGKLMFRTYFRLQKTSPEQEQAIILFLKSKFSWVTKVRGNWDIATMVFMDNHYEFDEMMREVFTKHGHCIETYWVAIMTKLHHCKRGYFTNKEDDKNILLEKTATVKIDDLDQRIINHLAEHGRDGFTEIGKALNINEKLVRDRMKRLTEQGILLGYTTFLNIPKLGIQYYKLHFTLQDKSQAVMQRMLQLALRHPNIPYMVEGVGCDDVEIEVQVPSSKELYAIIDLYRSTFKDNIRSFTFMEYVEEYAFSYTAKTGNNKNNEVTQR